MVACFLVWVRHDGVPYVCVWHMCAVLDCSTPVQSVVQMLSTSPPSYTPVAPGPAPGPRPYPTPGPEPRPSWCVTGCVAALRWDLVRCRWDSCGFVLYRTTLMSRPAVGPTPQYWTTRHHVTPHKRQPTGYCTRPHHVTPRNAANRPHTPCLYRSISHFTTRHHTGSAPS